MDDKLLKVKVIFDKVREMRDEIGTLFEGLEGRISKLTEVYNEFIKRTRQIKTADTNIFIFSLDSFYFQNNLLKREYKYLNEYYNILINRMYGEYYKLYKLIVEYVVKSQIDNKLSETLKNKKYPKYDDLNHEKHYDFALIVQLNEDIIGIISHLINVLRDKEHDLNSYITNQGYGLNVNNFVSTFNYEVIVLKEQIMLYEKYLDFFYHIHEKLLKRLITKISLLEAQLNADITFEGGLIGKRKDNNTLMNDMNMNGLSKRTAKDLRRSIIGNKSPYSSSTDDEITENYQQDFTPIQQPSITLNVKRTATVDVVEEPALALGPPFYNNTKSLLQNIFENSENSEYLESDNIPPNNDEIESEDEEQSFIQAEEESSTENQEEQLSNQEEQSVEGQEQSAHDQQEPSADQEETSLDQEEQLSDQEETSLDTEEQLSDQEETSVDQEEQLSDQEEQSVDTEEPSSDNQEETSVDQEEQLSDQEETSLDTEEPSADQEQSAHDQQEPTADKEETSVDSEEPSADNIINIT